MALQRGVAAVTGAQTERTENRGTGERAASGGAAARRLALTDAGLERPVAEVVVDLIDDAVAPLMTREEADSRFEAMLAHFDVRWDQERAERARERAEDQAERARERAEDRAELAKLASRIEARLGEMEGRFGEMEGRFGEMEGRFGELRGSIERLRADLTWRVLLVFCATLAAIAAIDRLLG